MLAYQYNFRRAAGHVQANIFTSPTKAIESLRTRRSRTLEQLDRSYMASAMGCASRSRTYRRALPTNNDAGKGTGRHADAGAANRFREVLPSPP